MSFSSIAASLGKKVSDNSPIILTAIGVSGVVGTAVLASQASFKAYEVIRAEEQISLDVDMTLLSKREKIEMTWKLYIPAAGVASTTIAAIILANRIGTRRAAVMASAYALSEKAFVEYKDKVIEKYGERKEEAVRDEIAQDHVRQNPVNNQTVVVTGGGEVLCYDMHTGRYFQSSMETMKKAQNDLNYTLLNEGYASLNDFYSHLGLPHIKTGEEFGWTSDNLLELKFSTTMSDDERPCLAMDFYVGPARNYFRTH